MYFIHMLSYYFFQSHMLVFDMKRNRDFSSICLIPGGACHSAYVQPGEASDFLL